MFRLLFLFLVLMTPLFPQKAILLNTMPKSGSVFLIQSMMTALKPCGYNFIRISHNRFHDDYVIKRTIVNAETKLFFTQEHIDASPANLALLEQYMPKLILHLRDPRQAMLSWVHHVEKSGIPGQHLWSNDICSPNEYDFWNLPKRIDWQIEHYLPALVTWIQEWEQAIDSNKLDILVTRYEDMVQNPYFTVSKMLEFYKLPTNTLKIPIPQPGEAHFRVGKTDEWKSVMSKAQIERMHEIIPMELLKRFGWE